MVDAPVDAQAVLLLLHAPLALAAVELAGEQGRHRAPALVLGVGAQLVGSVACDALPEGPEFGAADGVVGAGLACLEAVPARADSFRHTFCKKKGEGGVRAMEQPQGCSSSLKEIEITLFTTHATSTAQQHQRGVKGDWKKGSWRDVEEAWLSLSFSTPTQPSLPKFWATSSRGMHMASHTSG